MTDPKKKAPALGGTAPNISKERHGSQEQGPTTANAPRGSASVNLSDRALQSPASDGIAAVLPADLLALRAWLVWRYSQPDANGKRRKVPHYTNGRKRHGTQGSPRDLQQLATFEQAAQVVGAGKADGMGLAMLPAHGLTAFDFDPKEGALSEAEVRELLPDCYIERSPSGKGFRAFVVGTMPKINGGARGIEAFSEDQFVTVTGNALEGVPSKLGNLTDELRQRIETMAAKPAAYDRDDGRVPRRPLGIDLAAAQDLIEHLPESSLEEYHAWLRAGMALHHEFGGSEKALELWDQWSQASPRFQEGICEVKWRTFGKPGKDEVTLRSLVREAEATGWRAPATIARAVKDFDKREAHGALVIVGADEIDIESIDWLWPGRLPRGFLSVYAADGGSGKSTVTAAIAAVLTKGGTWPDHDLLAARRPPSDVLWLGVEDPLAQVTVPRLMAAGADLSRVRMLKGVTHPGQDGEELFSLQDDLQLMRDWIRQQRAEGRDVSLIVVDPVTSYLHGKRKIDSYKATELRSVLTPFATMADEEHVAVICITHLTKDKSRGFVDSVLGSQALTAVARNVWGFARVPGEGDNSFAMFWGKGNLGSVPPSLRYAMSGAEVISKQGEIVATSKIVWGMEDATVTRDSIYGGARGPLPQLRNEVAAWLRARLQDGQWHDATAVKDEALEAGFTAGTLRRAADEVCERQMHRGRGRWRLLPSGG